MSHVELRLPEYLLMKSVKSVREYGWRKDDVLEVIASAVKNSIAIIGGQVQYTFPDGTCELYWLSYDSEGRRIEEDWVEFCKRSAFECSEKFKKIALLLDIEKEAISSFDFLKRKTDEGIQLSDHQIFILYFADQ